MVELSTREGLATLALIDMRSVPGQLRRSDPKDPEAVAVPAGPAGTGLDRLPALREAVTAAGAAVTVTVEGEQARGRLRPSRGVGRKPSVLHRAARGARYGCARPAKLPQELRLQ